VSRDESNAVLLGHGADNDGIDEWDNPAPMWWFGLFAITVVWGVWYMIDYTYISQHSQEKYYLAEVAAANEQWPDLNKAVAVSMDPAALAEGEKLYTANCVGCHAADLHGGIGPNLTDAVWIHGGTPEAVVKTITEGVPAKGMITWGPILGPAKISQVAAYILSKNVGGGEAAPAAPPVDGAAAVVPPADGSAAPVDGAAAPTPGAAPVGDGTPAASGSGSAAVPTGTVPAPH
jgi:cytochrome c oxidase cbb3-type subunit 3